MRIACIATSNVPSRTANSVQAMKVCQAFTQMDHEVRLWLPGRTPDMSWEGLSRHYGLREQFEVTWMHSLRRGRRYDFCFRAVQAARRWKAHVFYLWPLQAAALASSLGYPSILELHDRPQGRLGPFLFQRALRGSGLKRVLPITAALENYLAEKYDTTLEGPFSIVSPMGVDLERYQDLPPAEEARRALNLRGSVTVGYTGHLYPGRGIELLFELARLNPYLAFVWAGGEPAAIERWRKKLRDAEIENVQLLGFVPNERLPLVHAACDLFLMPYARRISVSSGGDTARFASPMKVFEYFAARRAIISSDLPVLREVLNESNSLLVPPEDVQAWHSALQKLVSDSALRDKLAEQAGLDASKYSWRRRAQNALAGIEV
jgi:glycosyltransferase involved in cell wall biosynthesis